MRTKTLLTGHEMPMLGLGTWKITKEQVENAIRLGYRHIDTAWSYMNQDFIGQAVLNSGVDRGDFFITSKAWRTHLRYDQVLSQFDETMRQLGLSYVDLYLIHWPNDEVPVSETLRAMERIVQDGRARSIGVANFDVSRVKQALASTSQPIAVSQFLYNSQHNPEETRSFCAQNGIVVTAYTPMRFGEVASDRLLADIGQRYGKTPGQVALRWLIQKDVVVIPKAGNERHQTENMDIFDWDLSEHDMSRIEPIGLDSGRNVTPPYRPGM